MGLWNGIKRAGSFLLGAVEAGVGAAVGLVGLAIDACIILCTLGSVFLFDYPFPFTQGALELAEPIFQAAGESFDYAFNGSAESTRATPSAKDEERQELLDSREEEEEEEEEEQAPSAKTREEQENRRAKLLAEQAEQQRRSQTQGAGVELTTPRRRDASPIPHDIVGQTPAPEALTSMGAKYQTFRTAKKYDDPDNTPVPVAQVSADRKSIHMHFRSKEDSMDFCRDLAKSSKSFFVRNKSGELMAYAKDGELYNPNTQKPYEAGALMQPVTSANKEAAEAVVRALLATPKSEAPAPPPETEELVQQASSQAQVV
jgi:hypothetical protein